MILKLEMVPYAKTARLMELLASDASKIGNKSVVIVKSATFQSDDLLNLVLEIHEGLHSVNGPTPRKYLTQVLDALEIFPN